MRLTPILPESQVGPPPPHASSDKTTTTSMGIWIWKNKRGNIRRNPLWSSKLISIRNPIPIHIIRLLPPPPPLFLINLVVGGRQHLHPPPSLPQGTYTHRCPLLHLVGLVVGLMPTPPSTPNP